MLVSYDDAAAFQLKGEFVLDAGLRGFSFVDIGGMPFPIALSTTEYLLVCTIPADHNTVLLDAIREGAAFEDDEDCEEDEELEWVDVDAGDDESKWNWVDVIEEVA